MYLRFDGKFLDISLYLSGIYLVRALLVVRVIRINTHGMNSS